MARIGLLSEVVERYELLSEPARFLQTCAICLDPEPKHPTFLSTCLHCFCYDCITRWYVQSPECPLCKQRSPRLIHSVGTDMTFQQVILGRHDGRHPLPSRPNPRLTSGMTATSTGGNESATSTVSDVRSGVYRFQLRCIPLNSAIRRKIPRESLPKETQRIEPWLTRELRIALPTSAITAANATSNPQRYEDVLSPVTAAVTAGGETLPFEASELRTVTSIVWSAILRIGLEDISRLEDELSGLLFGNTTTFIHELLWFARSGYDVNTYNTLVRYTLPQASNTECIVIDEDTPSDFDSTPHHRPLTPHHRSNPRSHRLLSVRSHSSRVNSVHRRDTTTPRHTAPGSGVTQDPPPTTGIETVTSHSLSVSGNRYDEETESQAPGVRRTESPQTAVFSAAVSAPPSPTAGRMQWPDSSERAVERNRHDVILIGSSDESNT